MDLFISMLWFIVSDVRQLVNLADFPWAGLTQSTMTLHLRFWLKITKAAAADNTAADAADVATAVADTTGDAADTDADDDHHIKCCWCIHAEQDDGYFNAIRI